MGIKKLYENTNKYLHTAFRKYRHKVRMDLGNRRYKLLVRVNGNEQSGKENQQSISR